MPKKTSKKAITQVPPTVEPKPHTTPPVVSEDSGTKPPYGPTKSGIVTVALLIALALVIAGLGITRQIMNARGVLPKGQMSKGDYPKVVVDDGTGEVANSTKPSEAYVAPFYSNTKVGGLMVSVYQDSKNRKSYEVYLPNGKKVAMTSDANPVVIALHENELRFIISKTSGLNMAYYLVNADGSMRTLMTETDDIMFIGTSTSAVSHDNSKISYTAVSVQHDTCGGPVVEKLPDYSGKVVELHTTSLITGETVTVMANERVPLATTTNKLDAGVELLGYTSDDTKAIVSRRVIHACGGFTPTEAYLVTLVKDGTVKLIPYKPTQAEDKLQGLQASGVSPDGKYFYYAEVPNDKGSDVVHRYELTTGSDTIVK